MFTGHIHKRLLVQLSGQQKREKSTPKKKKQRETLIPVRLSRASTNKTKH
jgi:hypothetical protein